MTRRKFDPGEPEWMDRPQPVSPALVRDLANLRFLNRWFGGRALVLAFLRRWLTPDRAWRLLDLGAGSADIPRAIAELARRRGIRIEIDAVDQQESTLAIARDQCARHPEIRFHAADLRAFGGASEWDIVLCSLTLHHFSDDDAVAVLRRCRELSARYVLVSDLRRSRAGSAAVALVTATLLREPMTRHDARLSMARAFSFRELGELAERAGWSGFGHARFLFWRQAVWIG